MADIQSNVSPFAESLRLLSDPRMVSRLIRVSIDSVPAAVIFGVDVRYGGSKRDRELIAAALIGPGITRLAVSRRLIKHEVGPVFRAEHESRRVGHMELVAGEWCDANPPSDSASQQNSLPIEMERDLSKLTSLRYPLADPRIDHVARETLRTLVGRDQEDLSGFGFGDPYINSAARITVSQHLGAE